MAKSYADLQKQLEALQAEADRVRQKEISGVVSRIKEAIQTYGLTASDLGLVGRPKGTREARASVKAGISNGRRGKVKKLMTGQGGRAVKYRNDEGQTWAGRGARPQWLRDALNAGKRLEDFSV